MIGRSVDRATITRSPLASTRSAITGGVAAVGSVGAGGAMRSPSGSRALAVRIAGGTVRNTGIGAGLRQLSSATPSGRWLSSR